MNVGRPRLLGRHQGREVSSGIAKQPVPAPVLALGAENLAGDGQADLRVHGGPDKAVYAYPSEHLPWWAGELGHAAPEDLGPAPFGENLSTVGCDEDDTCIGDRWAWGDALLEVAQPRSPCYKLGLHRGQADLPGRFTASGRTGWYLRVLRPGPVPTAGPITVVERHPLGATVGAVFAALHHDDVPDEVLEALLLVTPLAEAARRSLARRRWG